MTSLASLRDRQLVLDPASVEAATSASGDNGEDAGTNDDVTEGTEPANVEPGFTEYVELEKPCFSEEEEAIDDDDRDGRGSRSIAFDGRQYKALSSSQPIEAIQDPACASVPDVDKTKQPMLSKRCVPTTLCDKRKNFAKLYRYASGPEIVVHSVADDDLSFDTVETGRKRRRTYGGPGVGLRYRSQTGGGKIGGVSLSRFPFRRGHTASNDDGNSGGIKRQTSGDRTSNVAASPSLHSTTSYLREQIIALFQVSDNKLAMKLFGNKNALQKEKQRQKAVGKCVIHPCSSFRFYWDLCMLILLIANLIILPVGISFFNDDLSVRWIVFNTISDTVFLIDLAINFRTGIIADNYADEIILDPKEIAKHYLKTWFLLDLISSLPLDYVITLISPQENVSQLVHAGRALRMFRLVKLLSLLRLLRLSRLVRYVSQWEESMSSAAAKFIRFFNLIAMILLLAHWNGCLQFLVPMLQDFPPDSWVIIEDLEFLSFAGVFMSIVNLILLVLLIGHWIGCLQFLVPMLQDFPENTWVAVNQLQDADWSEQYTWSLFKALSHMLSIGYGRYPPQSLTDVWLTMVSMLTGATCYALFVGHSTTLIQSFDTSRRLYNDKLKQVEEYMASRKLPRALRQRITEYYEHRYHGKMFHEESIMAELNECLREEIVSFNCRTLVASVPFFSSASPEFVSEVVSHLHFEVFQPGDLIVRAGTIGEQMYFLQEGFVSVLAENGDLVTSLAEGSYFGEISLMYKQRRVASIRAETYCNVFTLSAEHFTSILEHHPEMKQTMEYVIRERLLTLAAAKKTNEPPTCRRRHTPPDYQTGAKDSGEYQQEMTIETEVETV